MSKNRKITFNPFQRYLYEYMKDYKVRAEIPVQVHKVEHSLADFKEVRFHLHKNLMSRLISLAKLEQAELKTVFQTIWGILLQKYNNTNDVMFGCIVKKEITSKKEEDCFEGIIPIRVKYHKQEIFSKILRRVHQLNIEVEQYHLFPTDLQISKEKYSHLIDHLVVFENEVKITNSYRFICSVNFSENIIKFIYNQGQYSSEFVDNIFTHLVQIVNEIYKNNDIPVAEVQIVAHKEKQLLLEEFNQTKTVYPREKTLHELFEAEVEKNPERLAVVFENEKITYKELNAKANQVAHVLRRKGVEREAFVGIMMDRSVEMIVAILGVLKAGAAYLPIDPTYPFERIEHMLDDSGAKYLLVQKKIDIPIGYFGEIVEMDDPQLCQEDPSNLEQIHTPNDLAYMIYTSGSTGKPKGVMIEHQGVNNFCLIAETYGIIPGSRVLQFSSISFDASVGEIFPTLLTGATLYLAKKELLLSGNDFVKWLKEKKITSAVFPPSVLRALPYEELPDLTTIITAGEACSPDLVQLWGKGRTFINAYGPTEATVGSTVAICTSDMNKPPIGTPNPNKKIYIVNSEYQLQPIGVPGELCIGGDGLAKGYWNRPDLTAEKFVPHPFVPGERMYKTGDLARWLPDGSIDYLGRVDDQVKVRGYRIEPGEIERQLLKYEAVKEAAVIAFTDEEGQTDLCAYFVAVKKCSHQELRQHMLDQLPEYMVPSYFIALDDIPLTPNGKVDKKSLPKPDRNLQTGVEYASPANPTEEVLVEIWQEVLKVKQVGIHDHFVFLGGHSLRATMLKSRILKELGVEISSKAIFDYPTVREQAAFIQQLEKTSYENIEAVQKQMFYPVSSIQKRLYAVQQLEGVDCTYNLPTVLVVKGSLDFKRLQKTFETLIQRHETLRTSFHLVEGKLVQKVHPKVVFNLHYMEEADEDVEDLINTFIKPFDLSDAPLFRVGIIRQNKEQHILLLDMHHIIADAVSKDILNREFALLYQDRKLPELTIQYKDYTVWQKTFEETSKWKEQENYWLNQFSGELPVLELATDYPRSLLQQFDGRKLSFNLTPKMTNQLKQTSTNQGVTLYMLLLASYQVLLFKYTGQEDIIVGTPIMGRSNTQLESIFGMFVNTLAIRSYPQATQTFAEYLSKVKDQVFVAYQHEDYPLDELVNKLGIRRDSSRNPLFDTMFVLQNMDINEIEIPGLDFKPYRIEWKKTAFELTWEAVEKDGLQFTVEYSTSLFKQATVERMFSHFKQILHQVTAHPYICLSEIELVTAKEKQLLLEEFNQTKTVYPQEKTLHELFEAQVEKNPERLAVVFEKEEATYKQLNARANQVARVLRRKGVEREAFVGIMMDRSIEMIVAILGVLKAGAAYVPIDPTYPCERIEHMLNDSGTKHLLVQKKIDIPIGYFGEIVEMDDPQLCQEEPSNLEQINTPNDLAYMIYTSGSTGKPKGVMIEHQGVNNFCLIAETYGIIPGSRVLQFSSISFDASVGEIFPTLLTGATLYLARKELLLSGNEFVGWLKEKKITSAVFPPSVLRALPYEELPDLTTIITAGEACSPDLVQLWGEGRTFINAYGPTEATVGSTVAICTSDINKPPIGTPNHNKKIYIVNSQYQLQPIGVPGELCIGGDGLAKGYWNRPDLTAEKFVPHPFAPGERIYKTGDLARWLPDGSIDYLGRVDDQVKVRGYRIEPGEIERHFLKYEAVKEAAVIAFTDEEGQTDLCAYFVAVRKCSLQELRQHMLNQLPEYMVPSYFIALDDIPLTPNGKVDKKSLPKPDRNMQTGVEYVSPTNPTEEVLVEIWQEVLKVNQIGIHDHFVELGGDSIKAIQILARLYERNLKLDINELFRRQTISEIAPYIEHTQMVIEQSSVEGKVPLTPIQLWFFEQKMAEAHHWNQAMTLYRENGWSPETIKHAFKKLVDHHDVLRMKYSYDGESIAQIMQDPEGEHVSLQVFDFTQELDAHTKIELEANKLQRSIDLGKGPLVRLGLFQTNMGDYLLIIVHHLVIDGVSWRILLEDFETVYLQIKRNEQIKLPSKTHSYKTWSYKLRKYANSEKLLKELSYWNEIEKMYVPSLPKDMDGPNTYFLKDNRTVSVTLTEDQTTQLLTDVHSAYQTKVDQLLIAALLLTIREWTSQKTIAVNLEGHGREEIIDGLNLSRTIGWFTSIYPAVFSLNSDDLAYVIKFVKETLHRIPNKGIGYSILKYLRDPEENQTICFGLQPQISFNYLGMFDQKGAYGFGQSPIPMGDFFSKKTPIQYALEINGVVINHKLQISFGFNKYVYNLSTIERLADRYKHYLLAIATHCMEREDIEFTPSDFSAKKLSIEELDDIFMELEKM